MFERRQAVIAQLDIGRVEADRLQRLRADAQVDPRPLSDESRRPQSCGTLRRFVDLRETLRDLGNLCEPAQSKSPLACVAVQRWGQDGPDHWCGG
jgi:hypothetical protein